MNLPIQHQLRQGDFELSVDTEIPASGITGVFGASGSGKTTLLRCMAGLEGRAASPHTLGIAFVQQQPQLFPHLDVHGNILYGAARSAEQTVDPDSVIELLDLRSLLPRRVDGLSGGEAQRVALARALSQSPRMVLLDEPLAAVDEGRKSDLLRYLSSVQAQADIPFVYVSHDIDEICQLCHSLLVMERGRVVAGGPLEDVLSRLDLPQFSGENTGVMIDAEVAAFDAAYELTTLRFAGGELTVPGAVNTSSLRVRIRASDVSLMLEPPLATSILNVLPVTVDAISEEPGGGRATALLRLRAGETSLVARITRRSVEQLGLAVGQRAFAQIKSVTVRR